MTNKSITGRDFDVCMAEAREDVPTTLRAWYFVSAFFAMLWMPVTLLKNYLHRLIALILGREDPRKMQRSSSFWFDGFCFVGSEDLRSIRRQSASALGLNLVYHRFGDFGRSLKHEDTHVLSKFTEFHADAWYSMPVAVEVRERLRIASELMREGIRSFRRAHPFDRVELLDVAGGCGYLSMKAIKEVMEEEEFDFMLHLIDYDDRIVKFVEWNRRAFNLDPARVKFYKAKISSKDDTKSLKAFVERISTADHSFAVAVMIGLLDYKDDDGSVSLVRQLRSVVSPHGSIITCNIRNYGLQQLFLRELIHWPMHFRTLDQWEHILVEAGCHPLSTQIVMTPKGMFMVTSEVINGNGQCPD